MAHCLTLQAYWIFQVGGLACKNKGWDRFRELIKNDLTELEMEQAKVIEVRSCYPTENENVLILVDSQSHQLLSKYFHKIS